jgi:hypothetical protein
VIVHCGVVTPVETFFLGFFFPAAIPSVTGLLFTSPMIQRIAPTAITNPNPIRLPQYLKVIPLP